MSAVATLTRAEHRGASPATTPARAVGARPAALAVDIGSGWVGLQVAGQPGIGGPSDAFAAPRTLVSRGRITDPAGCGLLLRQLLRSYDRPVPAGAVVLACRPVRATVAEQLVLRQVLADVFSPSRLLFIDTVRAAAIGTGAAAGHLLIADIGAQLSEVALLGHGRVGHAHRADLGTADLSGGVGSDVLAAQVAQAVEQVLREAGPSAELAAAQARGLLLVGDGATRPHLVKQLSARLGLPVHVAAAPRTAALAGASLASASAARHPAPVASAHGAPRAGSVSRAQPGQLPRSCR